MALRESTALAAAIDQSVSTRGEARGRQERQEHQGRNEDDESHGERRMELAINESDGDGKDEETKGTGWDEGAEQDEEMRRVTLIRARPRPRDMGLKLRK